MKNFLLLFVLTCLISLSSHAQVNVWQAADPADVALRSDAERYSAPSEFGLYRMTLDDLRAELANVPHESQLNARNSYAKFDFPMPDGSLRTFNLVEYQMMEPELMRKFPKLKTYTGVDIANGSKIHLNLTSDQFFASIREKGVTYYIDPYLESASPFYVSYNIRDDRRNDQQLHCANTSLQIDEVLGNNSDPSSSDELLQKRGEAFTLRTYRLAVTATSGFSTFHGGTVQDALDAITTIVNRINSVYEREVAIRLILIGREDEMIFTDVATDPFDGIPIGDQQAMMNQNQITTSTILNSSEYDIGHVFNTNTNDAPGQGIAQSPCVCANNSKARGASARPIPRGDAFTIAIICHEMGHQFSAQHTMYHCQNVNIPTSYSPGSGTTMMSYAGICSNVANVINTSDDYFHNSSISSIINYSRNGGGGSCGGDIDFGNTYPDPILNYPALTYIPVSTPIYLEGTAVDAETPNSLTYCWEQYDNGFRDYENSPWDIGTPRNNEPLFRSREPVVESGRYFPALPIVVNSSNYLFEQYATYERDLTFRMTVRDNMSENGGAAWEEMSIKVIDNSAAGEFQLTSFATKDTVKSGEYVEINWNVADTDLPPISTERVNIRLSVDGGLSFPYLLKDGTPNDGSTFVNFPDTTADRFRVMIQAANNIYYNVTRRSSLLCVDSLNPAIGLSYNDEYFQICGPDVISMEINTFGLGGFDDVVTFEVIDGLPPGAVATFSQTQAMVGTPTTLTIDLENVTQGGEFELRFKVTGTGIDDQVRTVDLQVTSANFVNLNLNSPSNGATNVELVPTLSWSGVPDADNYTVELSEDLAFTNIIFTVENTMLTEATVANLLDAGTVYFWRVLPTNRCGEFEANRISAFQTKALSCDEYCSTASQILIPSATTSIIEMPIDIGSAQVVDEINVTNIKGRHADMSQLKFTIQNPDGTTVILLNNGSCPWNSNYDMGFDDDAIGVTPNCGQFNTFNEGTRFEPIESLSALNGNPSGTEYKLIVEDVLAGQGGNLQSWCVELCGAADVEGATLVNADSIHLAILSSRVVGDDKLVVSHTQFGAAQLTITVVDVPKFGAMLIDGVPAIAGDQLTMQDVIDNKLVYQHQNMAGGIDQFTFIVTDPGGGFLGTPRIRFYIGGTAIEDNLPEGSELKIYPNPAGQDLFIKLEGTPVSLDRVVIYDLQGRLISRFNDVKKSELAIDLSAVPAGFYLIDVMSGDYRAIRKFVKQ